MAHVMDGSSLERRPLLIPQLAYDPNYGGIIGISESMRPGACAVNVDPSDESDLYLTASEDSDDQEIPPSTVQRDLPDGQQDPDSESPAVGDPAPEPVDRPLEHVVVEEEEVEEEEEEEEEEEKEEETACKCCTSWYDWCLLLSCKLTILVSPLRMPLRERKCLRRARTEGWRLLWSLVLPLAVGSVPLQLVWVIAQLITSLALFSLSMVDCVSNECIGWNVVCAFVSGVWMLLTLVDTIVCLVTIRFYRSQFVWKISPYITVLRMIYTVICLHIVVIGFKFPAGFEFQPQNITVYEPVLNDTIYEPLCLCNSTVKNIQSSLAKSGFSFASLCVFVDLTLLIVAVQFTRKSLRLRNAYSEAQGLPTNKAEGFFLFHTAFELSVHFLLLFTWIFLWIFEPAYGLDYYYCVYYIEYAPVTSETCCQYVLIWYYITAGVYAGLLIAVPPFGLLSIYFIDYFWFQKYLASVCLSAQSILQDRETVARLGIPVNASEMLQERLQRICPVLLKKSVKKFFKNKVTFIRKVLHLCENPFSIVYSHLIFGILLLWLMVLYLPWLFIDPARLTYPSLIRFIAALMFATLHLRSVVFVIIFLPIVIVITLTGPLSSCLVCIFFLPTALLLWPLCSSHSCCRCTHCCKADLVP